MFRDAVRDFADQEVRPRVAAMERAAAIDQTLIPKLFELGLMGIEIPEAYGGAGGGLFMTAFRNTQMGYAAAESFILFGIILVVSLFSMRTLRGEVAYQ